MAVENVGKNAVKSLLLLGMMAQGSAVVAQTTGEPTQTEIYKAQRVVDMQVGSMDRLMIEWMALNKAGKTALAQKTFDEMYTKYSAEEIAASVAENSKTFAALSDAQEKALIGLVETREATISLQEATEGYNTRAKEAVEETGSPEKYDDKVYEPPIGQAEAGDGSDLSGGAVSSSYATSFDGKTELDNAHYELISNNINRFITLNSDRYYRAEDSDRDKKRGAKTAGGNRTKEKIVQVGGGLLEGVLREAGGIGEEAADEVQKINQRGNRSASQEDQTARQAQRQAERGKARSVEQANHFHKQEEARILDEINHIVDDYGISVRNRIASKKEVIALLKEEYPTLNISPTGKLASKNSKLLVQGIRGERLNHSTQWILTIYSLAMRSR